MARNEVWGTAGYRRSAGTAMQGGRRRSFRRRLPSYKKTWILPRYGVPDSGSYSQVQFQTTMVVNNAQWICEMNPTTQPAGADSLIERGRLVRIVGHLDVAISAYPAEVTPDEYPIYFWQWVVMDRQGSGLPTAGSMGSSIIRRRRGDVMLEGQTKVFVPFHVWNGVSVVGQPPPSAQIPVPQFPGVTLGPDKSLMLLVEAMNTADGGSIVTNFYGPSVRGLMTE